MKTATKKYYWITNFEILPGVTPSWEGILANENGHIHLFDLFQLKDHLYGMEVILGDVIALKQEDLTKYTIVEINSKGIKGTLVPDEVGMWTQKYQWVLTQPKICPSYCKVISNKVIDINAVNDFELTVNPSTIYSKSRKTKLEVKNENLVCLNTFYDEHC